MRVQPRVVFCLSYREYEIAAVAAQRGGDGAGLGKECDHESCRSMSDPVWGGGLFRPVGCGEGIGKLQGGGYPMHFDDKYVVENKKEDIRFSIVSCGVCL